MCCKCVYLCVEEKLRIEGS